MIAAARSEVPIGRRMKGSEMLAAPRLRDRPPAPPDPEEPTGPSLPGGLTPEPLRARRAPSRAARARRTTGRTAPCTGRSPAWCTCLLYTSDAADERSSVDLGGRRII